MPKITAKQADYVRLSQYATVPGVMNSSSLTDNGDGTVSFEVSEDIAESLTSRIDPDINRAFVDMLDLMDSGRQLRAN